MLINFLSALALVFVFEGIMPFVVPDSWKRMMQKIVNQDIKILRFFGLISMVTGVVFLSIIHQFAE